ncbi:MAG: hypothetical protein ACREQV_11835 [Candidatus Binatia bacterium]
MLPSSHITRHVQRTIHRLTVLLTSKRLPLAVATALLLVGGFLLLGRADRQARDITRKHHIEDIEQALYFARATHGTFPPYNQPTWCGLLHDPAHTSVRAQVEEVLRASHEQYANHGKPFPTDPTFSPTEGGYFYWKRSPSSFELYARLEEDPSGERNTLLCEGAPPIRYDYGVASVRRERGAPQDPTIPTL